MNNENKWQDLFNNPDLYPTPREVLDMMQLNVSGDVILEPSSGKGNIIDYLKEHGSKEVIYCEINNDLAKVCSGKARFLKNDFLKVEKEEVSHINQIIMNPPFSTSKTHLIHAWNIAPDGCEITSLFNTNTLDNLPRELKQIINYYGNTMHIGNVFSNSERQTNVQISIIKLYKPISNENSSFDGFYMDEEPNESSGEGIMKYNEVKALVNNYISAAKSFDEFRLINEKIKQACNPVGMGNGFSYHISYNESVSSKEDFLKALQKKSWKYIFNKMKLDKYLTSGVMNDINRFVEQQSNVPFSVKNIYRMFDIIVGTKESSFNRALVEAIDNFTKHTAENRFGVEGWKTNSGYMLNRKFIIDYMFEVTESWYGVNAGKLKLRIGRTNQNHIEDLTKVICNLTGFDYNETRRLETMIQDFKYLEPGKWYENGFFEFRGYKKGTMHIKFVDAKVWELVNRAYAKIKGNVLPENIKFNQQ